MLNQCLNNQVITSYVTGTDLPDAQTNFLAKPFPCDTHLVNLKTYSTADPVDCSENAVDSMQTFLTLRKLTTECIYRPAFKAVASAASVHLCDTANVASFKLSDYLLFKSFSVYETSLTGTTRTSNGSTMDLVLKNMELVTAEIKYHKL